MPLYLDLLSADQLSNLQPENTVFFFAVGPLEDHGPHLPLGTDLIVARALCEEAARKLETELPGWKAVIAPPAPLGIDSNTNRVRLTVRGYVLRDWLVDICLSLYRMKFRHFVCFTGHSGPKQITAIEEAGILLKRKAMGSLFFRWLQKDPPPVLISANSGLLEWKDIQRSPLWPDPIEHGGVEDTSVVLHSQPDTLLENPAKLEVKKRASSHLERIREYHFGKVESYWGNPSQASAEKGAEMIRSRVQSLFPFLQATWKGGLRSPTQFRSWYSALPPNRSFFKAWALFFILFVLLLAWVYVSFNFMMGDL